MNLKMLLNSLESSSLAVLGDVCVDAYFFLTGEGSQNSLETGLATRPVKNFRLDLGGAGNVALNLKALKVRRTGLYGIVGNDAFGNAAASLLEGAGISPETLMIQSEGWDTHVYCKFYQEGREDPRIDMGNFNRPLREVQDRLLARLEKDLPLYQGVIINQQVSSTYQDGYFQGRIRDLILGHPEIRWFCDSRELAGIYDGTIRKLNLSEAREILRLYAPGTAGSGGEEDPEPDNRELLQELYRLWKQPLFITRGENGALAVQGEAITEVPGLHIIHQTDPVGAGDAFLAAAASALCTGASVEDSCFLGNLAAGVSVQKLFTTGHPEPAEILSIGTLSDFRYRPSLASDPRQAVFLPGTEIESITGRIPSGPPAFGLFDHDGTISTLRYGWDRVMLDLMVRSILGPAFASAPPALWEKAVQVSRDLIQRTTGVQTLVQMEGLVRLVGDFGLVPPGEILSPRDYKTRFNRDLMEEVAGRMEAVASGRLDSGDFTIKGAVPFLNLLHRGGVTLFLASGTDQEDVIREAELLGYAGLFSGGIRGSVGDIRNDPKKLAVEEILERIGPGAADSCVIFGDGPVEIREGAKRGILTVGIISDEKQRFGPNPDKRERLVLAGADYLIPDFSWAEPLLDCLGWRL